MNRIDSLAASHPRVGAILSPETESLRGQLASLGFTPCGGDDTGLDWLITDGAAVAPAGLPVLHLSGKISIYNLKQAIIALFDGRKA